MSSLTYDATTAKSLLTAEEYKLYEQAQTNSLDGLTQVQLKDLVVRSRTARDKWRDVSRTQKRSTQADRGHRQNAENARSKDKALLLSEVHQIFVDRQSDVDQGTVKVATGKKSTNVPRRDRKIVTRATRSITRDALKDKKRKINRAARADENIAGDTNQKSIESKSGKPMNTVKNVNKTSPKSTASKKSPAKKTGTSKKPVVTKSRKKMLAKQAEQAEKSQGSLTLPQSKPDLNAGITKAANAARNRPLQTKSTANRLKVGGNTRIKGHASSQGKRSQARRDAK